MVVELQGGEENIHEHRCTAAEKHGHIHKQEKNGKSMK